MKAEQTETLPAWWQAADREACAKYAEWKGTEWFPARGPGDEDPKRFGRRPDVIEAARRTGVFLGQHLATWTCRRCRFWQSADGVTGDCKFVDYDGGTFPLRVNLDGAQFCEDWKPREAVEWVAPAAAEAEGSA